MDEATYQDELLTFFKALADANRLKIVGLLAQGALSVEQLAEMLRLHPSTVSHHLKVIAKAGLVKAKADGYYNMYQLESGAIRAMAQRLLAKESLSSAATQADLDDYDRKVIKNYLTPEGQIKNFPVQLKKLQAILRYVVEAFEPGKRYSEKQVNEILARFNEDTARLRRNLVDYGYMDRQGGGGEYWRL